MKLLSYYREWLLLPLFIGGVIGVIQFYHWLTGRAPIDDPGELVSHAYMLLRVASVIALTAFTQEHLFGYRGDKSLRDDVYDAAVTFGLLVIFWQMIWN